MTEQEKAAREMLSNATLGDLLDEWELTSNVDDPSIPTVRGWLMDELESRNSEAFNAWLDQEAPEDEQLRDFMTQ